MSTRTRPFRCRSLLLAAIAAGLLAMLSPAPAAGGDDLTFETEILHDAAQKRPNRVRAAERLLRAGTPTAIESLRQALAEGDQELVGAVAEAMQGNPPVPELLDPAATVLRTLPLAEQPPLWSVLSRAGRAGLDRVLTIALDETVPVAQRIGPVHAIGAFRNRQCAREGVEALMALLEPARSEPEEITNAVYDSLRRISGIPKQGNEAQEWISWWAIARHEPIEQWIDRWVDDLIGELAAVRSESDTLRSDRDALAVRLAAALREQFIALDPAQRLEALPTLLGDDVPEVRAFAVAQIDTLLRNGTPPPEPVRDQLATLLTDERPETRAVTATLLDRLNHPEVAARVARALETEAHPATIDAFLGVLARRPAALAVDRLCLLTKEPAHAPAAARALERLVVTADALDEAQRAQVLVAAREAVQPTPTPEATRLLALIGEETDLDAVEAMLETSEDGRVRASAAAGLVARSRYVPVVALAGDADVYPHAVRAVAASLEPMPALAQLATMPPPEPHVRVWNETVIAEASGLAPESLLEADDLVAPLAWVTPATRIDMLSRAGSIAVDAWTPEQRIGTVARLASLLLAASRASEAHQLLEKLNGQPVPEDVADLRFRVAINARDFDRAATLVPDPARWVDLLQELSGGDAALAQTLGAEIGSRFAAELEGPLRAEYDAALDALSKKTEPGDGGSVAGAGA